MMIPPGTAALIAIPRPPGAVVRARATPKMDLSVTLTKPLGIVLEELGSSGGVRVEALQDGGAAALDGSIVPGDTLLKVGEQDVSKADLDKVMDVLRDAPPTVSLELSDGLGRLDITPNLAKSLGQSDAFLVDAVVRAAVREVRRLVSADEEVRKELGYLQRVEIVLGAGVRDDGRCLVRFFGIFSTGGAGSYSCNVSATGIRAGEGVEITALSCAKDEGWGRTIDLKRE